MVGHGAVQAGEGWGGGGTGRLSAPIQMDTQSSIDLKPVLAGPASIYLYCLVGFRSIPAGTQNPKGYTQPNQKGYKTQGFEYCYIGVVL